MDFSLIVMGLTSVLIIFEVRHSGRKLNIYIYMIIISIPVPDDCILFAQAAVMINFCSPKRDNFKI